MTAGCAGPGRCTTRSQLHGIGNPIGVFPTQQNRTNKKQAIAGLCKWSPPFWIRIINLLWAVGAPTKTGESSLNQLEAINKSHQESGAMIAWTLADLMASLLPDPGNTCKQRHFNINPHLCMSALQLLDITGTSHSPTCGRSLEVNSWLLIIIN